MHSIHTYISTEYIIIIINLTNTHVKLEAFGVFIIVLDLGYCRIEQIFRFWRKHSQRVPHKYSSANDEQHKTKIFIKRYSLVFIDGKQ